MKKRINITIEEDLLYKLDFMAVQRGIDRSSFIGLLVYHKFSDTVSNTYLEEEFYCFVSKNK